MIIIVYDYVYNKWWVFVEPLNNLLFHLQARSSSRFETNGKGHENHFHSYFKWWIFLSNFITIPNFRFINGGYFLTLYNVSLIILEFIFLDKLTIMNTLHKGVLKKVRENGNNISSFRETPSIKWVSLFLFDTSRV